MSVCPRTNTAGEPSNWRLPYLPLSCFCCAQGQQVIESSLQALLAVEYFSITQCLRRSSLPAEKMPERDMEHVPTPVDGKFAESFIQKRERGFLYLLFFQCYSAQKVGNPRWRTPAIRQSLSRKPSFTALRPRIDEDDIRAHNQRSACVTTSTHPSVLYCLTVKEADIQQVFRVKRQWWNQ